MEALLLLILNIGFLMLLCMRQNDITQYYYRPDPTIATTYFLYIYPVLVLVTDFLFSLFHTYKARVSEPYNYARRFLRNNSDSVYADVMKEKERLSDYISGAINNQIMLKDDIHDFSKLSSSYVDFSAVLNVSKLREKKMYKTLHAFNIAFETLTAIFGFTFLILLIFSLAFGITI